MNASSETPAVPGQPGTPEESAPLTYVERLRTPLWWYLVGIGVAAIFAAEFHIAGYNLTDWIPWTTLPVLAVVIVWVAGSGKLVVADGEIRVRGAHLPLNVVSGVVALDPATLRRVVGREGDPSAFVSIRPWIGGGVQLWLDDPQDPTPYWIVSTRHPEELVKVLRSYI